jgi:hypothetical protein
MFTFIVEDGTGVEGANSYITVELADEHISLYTEASDTWLSLDTEEKELRLIRATRFIDNAVFWVSTKVHDSNPLQWPRNEFIALYGRVIRSNEIPIELQQAVAELANESLFNTLTTDVVKLSREAFGDTADEYAVPVERGGSSLAREWVRRLSFLGYARNKTVVVQVYRA